MITQYPDNIEERLGFDQIRQWTIKRCLTFAGQEKIAQMPFYTQLDELLKVLQMIDELRAIRTLNQNFPLSHFEPLNRLFQKLKVDNAYMDIEDLLSLKTFLEVGKSVQQAMEHESMQTYHQLKDFLKGLVLHAYVSEQIQRVLSKKGEIKDNASQELQSIRKALRVRQAEVSTTIHRVYSKVKQSGWLEADLSVTIVNGRLLIPIDSQHKRKINGWVHDVSATGKTAYIEPQEVIQLNNEIVELERRESIEIDAILADLTDKIRPYADDLIQAYDLIAWLDLYNAKAKLAFEMEAIKPAIYEQPNIRLQKARHPILWMTFQKQSREVVPLNLRLEQNQNLVVISGPNAGGKSVALKTVGLLQLMLQYAYLLPVGGATEMGIFNKIFIDIGDQQSMDNDLSTYSSHLLNMKHFLKFGDSSTLILIDEFGTGTEPILGGAIAEAVLEKLSDIGVYGVITTHYSNLKHIAVSRVGLVNAAMLFDHQKMQPLYELELNQAGSSFAFEMARKIGLPEEVLLSASEKVGHEQVDFDKHLREVLRDKKYWSDKRAKIRQNEKEMDRLVEELTITKEQLEKSKKLALKEAQQEAKAILDEVNKKVEQTIRDIKQAQAEKEQTKAIRKEFDEFKEEILAKKQAENEDQLLKKIEKLRKRTEEKKPKRTIPQSTPKKEEQDKIIQIGAKVRIKDSDTYGEVLELQHKKATISVGQMQMQIDLNKLILVSNTEFKKKLLPKTSTNINVFSDSMSKKLHFSAHIDVRGQRVDEALASIQKFLDDAVSTETKSLKILHGTGTGALKVAIRQLLKAHECVQNFSDDLLELGGAGITVVQMSFD